jgi:hypothetical protein
VKPLEFSAHGGAAMGPGTGEHQEQKNLSDH